MWNALRAWVSERLEGSFFYWTVILIYFVVPSLTGLFLYTCLFLDGSSLLHCSFTLPFLTFSSVDCSLTAPTLRDCSCICIYACCLSLLDCPLPAPLCCEGRLRHTLRAGTGTRLRRSLRAYPRLSGIQPAPGRKQLNQPPGPNL